MTPVGSWRDPYFSAGRIRLWPCGVRRFHAQRKLDALGRFVDRIAGDGAGKAALRAHRKAIVIDEARGLTDPALQIVERLERGDLGADEPEHDALVGRDITQRRENRRRGRYRIQAKNA